MVAWFGGIDVSYISGIHVKRISDGDTTECGLGMKFVTWCIVKLYFFVTLCSDCRIFIVANDISHLGIKMTSWIWRVGDVTKTSEFYDHI